MGYYDIYYRAVVTGAARLTPSMVRVRLGGDGLSGWSSSGVADERLVIVFPAPGERQPVGPQQMPDGTQDYPDELTRPEMRSYTVRAFDPVRHEMVVDFVAHEGGVAASWAREAQLGDVVYLTQAAGWYDPPADAGWQLLVADLTALPALGRIVESLPAGSRAHVIAEVIDHDDAQPLPTAADLTCRWLTGSGNGVAASVLPDAVRRFEWPDGPGYVWFAGEAAASRAVRKYLRRERGWPAERYRILGYWRQGQEEWTARYTTVGAELETVYTEAVAAGHSSTEALELYDDALERVGL